MNDVTGSNDLDYPRVRHGSQQPSCFRIPGAFMLCPRLPRPARPLHRRGWSDAEAACRQNNREFAQSQRTETSRGPSDQEYGSGDDFIKFLKTCKSKQ